MMKEKNKIMIVNRMRSILFFKYRAIKEAHPHSHIKKSSANLLGVRGQLATALDGIGGQESPILLRKKWQLKKYDHYRMSS